MGERFLVGGDAGAVVGPEEEMRLAEFEVDAEDAVPLFGLIVASVSSASVVASAATPLARIGAAGGRRRFLVDVVAEAEEATDDAMIDARG